MPYPLGPCKGLVHARLLSWLAGVSFLLSGVTRLIFGPDSRKWASFEENAFSAVKNGSKRFFREFKVHFFEIRQLQGVLTQIFSAFWRDSIKINILSNLRHFVCFDGKTQINNFISSHFSMISIICSTSIWLRSPFSNKNHLLTRIVAFFVKWKYLVAMNSFASPVSGPASIFLPGRRRRSRRRATQAHKYSSAGGVQKT